MSLAGRVALVTGASRGIGQAVADRLEAAGAFVVRLARTLQAASGSTRQDIPCDVTREPDVVRVAARLAAEGRTPGILVNNAGSFLLKALADTSPAEFREQLEANLTGPFLVLRAFLPGMTRHGGGHVVTIGSIADHATLPGNAAYGAAKRGLRALHEVCVAEWSGRGIRATLVSPAATDTAIWDRVEREVVPALPPRHAMLRPGDVAEAVLFALTRGPGVVVDEIRISRRA